MPIIVYNRIAFVVTRSEFLNEYKQLDNDETSILKNITKTFNFEKSVQAITKIYEKEKQEKNPESRHYRFDYYGQNAQSILLELTLFFSKFYHKLCIYDSAKILQSIDEYVLPHKKKYFTEKSHIVFNDGHLFYTIYLNQIKRIRGLINNFVVYLDTHTIHFCCDVGSGQFISIEPIVVDSKNEIIYQINDHDYIFERNKPSKYKLLRYRQKGFLVIIQ